MTISGTDPSYAPFGLELDSTEFDLIESVVEGRLGTAVARSKRTNRSQRATIFLHGAAGSWTTWTPMLAVARAAGITISNPILLDLPGWGDATLSDEGELLVIEAVCSLVKETAEALGFTEWDLVGHSMGGFVAMHMAAIWPECVLSVGTVSATGWSVIEAVEHPVAHPLRLPGFVALWRVMSVLARLGGFGVGLMHGLRSAHLLRLATSPLFRHPFRIPASVIYALGDELRPRQFAAATTIARGYDATLTWSRIQCPVRAVQGDRDVFSRASDLALLSPDPPGQSRRSHRRLRSFRSSGATARRARRVGVRQ